MKGITKGDWKITDKVPNGILELKGYIEIATDDWSLACVFNDIEISEEAKANAELICTAGNITNAGYNIEAMPQLVEALEEIMNSIQSKELLNGQRINAFEALKSAKL